MLSDDETTLTDIVKEQIETYRQRDELKESCRILTQQLYQVSCERNDLQAELLTLRAENERLRGVLTTIADMSCQCVCQKATGIALDALTPPTKE